MPRKKRRAQRRKTAQRRRAVLRTVERIRGRQYRFGGRVLRKGRYKQEILDTHGRVVGTVPWHQEVRKEVAAVVRAVEGRARKGDVKRLGFSLPGWKLSAVGKRRGEPYYSRTVWEGEQPIGEPGGRVRGPRRGRAGRYLGRVFDVDLGGVDPRDWAEVVADAARRVGDPRRAYVGIRVHGVTRDGIQVSAFQPPTKSLEVFRADLFTWAGNRIQLLSEAKAAREFLSDAAARLAREYGYAGAVLLTRIDLTLYVLEEGLSLEVEVVPAAQVRAKGPGVHRVRHRG